MNLRDITEQHRYPGWLVRSPGWIFLHYRLLRLLFLRSRVCSRKLRELLDHSDAGPRRILDAGCGEGQYIVPLATRFPLDHFTGIDPLEEHIAFLNTLKLDRGLPNCTFVEDNLENHLGDPPAYTLIFIIGVLQYTSDPEQIIRSAYQSQDTGGKLMIYTPVTGGIEYGFYRFLRKRYGHYDDARQHYHPIDADALRAWVHRSGYRIVEEENHYGNLGSLGHQIMQSLLMLMTYWSGTFKVIPALFFIILMPIFVPLQMADTWIGSASRVRSNGLLLILQK